jgi:hypothetical protein
MEKINLSMVEIAFTVNGELSMGEEIRISGDAQALGYGDRERAIPMFTSPNDYPWWRTKEGNYWVDISYFNSWRVLNFLQLPNFNYL